MPTVTFPLAYLARLTTISPSQLVSQAFDYGLDATLQGEGLEVEVTAERPDLLAAEGFVRSLNIYNGQGERCPPNWLPRGGSSTSVPPSPPCVPTSRPSWWKTPTCKTGGWRC
jgi:phenylalanyl-tRNA synthetase beta chain